MTKAKTKAVTEGVAKETARLSDDFRVIIKKQLEDIGIDTTKLTDDELVKNLASQAANLFQHKVKSVDVDSLERSLDAYAAHTELSDKAFIAKLYDLNVPRFYLKLFKNSDAHLDRRQIWTRIRESKIRPISDVNEIFKQRGHSRRVIEDNH